MVFQFVCQLDCGRRRYINSAKQQVLWLPAMTLFIRLLRNLGALDRKRSEIHLFE